MYSTLERFLKYVTYDTQSVLDAPTVPSTPGQLVLAKEMAEELRALGLKDVEVTEHAYVTATLPGNSSKKVPAVGFIAHLDTATELTGKNVKPRVVKDYDCGDIVLNEAEDVVLSPRDFPFLYNYQGQDLVVTDGTTLLGADNKAGMAEVMGAVDYLVHHPEIEHGDVKVAFTPDEEVGHLAKLLDIEKFGADFAYTLDGGPIGEMCYENFNAANATVRIKGRAVHPGTAKGMMLSAVTMGHEFLSLFPPAEVPAATEWYEGFYHCTRFEARTEAAELYFIIRDHNAKKFAERKAFMERAVKWMRDRYGADRFELEMKDQYYNMADGDRGDEGAGHHAAHHPDAWRHGRSGALLARAPDPQHLHGRAQLPRSLRVHPRAGDGEGHRDGAEDPGAVCEEGRLRIERRTRTEDTHKGL